MVRKALLAAAMIASLVACRTVPNPVPVAGDLSLLAGEWSGTYEGEENGRSGSIVFRLEAGHDTAFGDVVMVPRGYAQALLPVERGYEQEPRMLPEMLTIAFVRAGDHRVSGTLDPYRHPECGCTLITTFTGEIMGDRVAGSYVTRTERGGIELGRWEVRRKRGAATAPRFPAARRSL